ncbi:hypothetical protein S40293_10312 [Stachybotrys chartarum IBT 40293]|nr:hypothetical protein S40293_10312 [Stachybotrys chartarum IBT 40293]
MPARIFTAITLTAIAIFGSYSIIGFPQRSGWADIFAKEIAQQEELLASIGQTSKTSFTGIVSLDAFLDQLIYFTIRCLSGQSKALSLLTTYFAGQVTATHAALVLEGLRAGNMHRIISYSAFWGMIYQAVPQGIMIPIYCAVYLWKSPLATDYTSLKPLVKAEFLSIDPIEASVVNAAMVLGYIMPTILIALPSPGVVTTKQQQVLLATWQFWPICVSIWHCILVFFSKVFHLVPEQAQQNPKSRLKYMRGVYRNNLIIASVFHFLPVTYMFSPMVRSMFSGTAEVGPVDVQAVFVPKSAFSSSPVSSVTEGCLIFLQYDMYCAFGAMLVWVMYLSYARAGYRTLSAAWAILQYPARTVLVGPGGAILWALQDRDEDALGGLGDKQE